MSDDIGDIGIGMSNHINTHSNHKDISEFCDTFSVTNPIKHDIYFHSIATCVPSQPTVIKVISRKFNLLQEQA